MHFDKIIALLPFQKEIVLFIVNVLFRIQIGVYFFV